MYTLAVNSTSNKRSPVHLARAIRPHLETWLFQNYEIEHHTFSIFSTRGDHLYQIDDLDIGLAAIQGDPKTVILHFTNRVNSNKPTPNAVDFWIKNHPSAKETNFTAKIIGHDIIKLTDARDKLTAALSGIIDTGEVEIIGPESGKSFPFNGGNASFKGSTTADVDTQDLSTRLGSPRVQRVFLSYSHDNDTHKDWVLNLALKLNSLGIWLHFDQWDASLGSDLPLFMEKSVSESDRIIAICTEEYKRKTDQGKGGSGYEKMLMTPELMQNQSSARVIPLVRSKTSPGDVIPTFLASKRYIDFSDDSLFTSRLDELASEIISAQGKRPPLGSL